MPFCRPWGAAWTGLSSAAAVEVQWNLPIAYNGPTVNCFFGDLGPLMIGRLCIAIAMIAWTGCGSANPQATESVTGTTPTPESAYRELMMAMLTGDENAVRNLIVEQDGAECLSEGAYPKEVAALLAEQYRTMEITRIENGNPGSVELNSSAFPLSLTVIKIDGIWKVDAGPIIKVRHKL